MRISALLACVMFTFACNPRGSVPFSPGEFPWVVSLPTTVRMKGEVRFERDGQYEFTLRDRREIVRGEKWAGHVTVAGFSAGDHRSGCRKEAPCGRRQLGRLQPHETRRRADGHHESDPTFPELRRDPRR